MIHFLKIDTTYLMPGCHTFAPPPAVLSDRRSQRATRWQELDSRSDEEMLWRAMYPPGLPPITLPETEAESTDDDEPGDHDGLIEADAALNGWSPS